jgi:hypothetical protein
VNHYFHHRAEKISRATVAPGVCPRQPPARIINAPALGHTKETMEALSSAVAVLTAMITPAVLISACGALILSTSTRLGRVVDRVRMLIERFEEMMNMQQDEGGVELFEERRTSCSTSSTS